MSQFGYLILNFEPCMMLSNDFVSPHFPINHDRLLEGIEEEWPSTMFDKRHDSIYEWVNQDGVQQLVKTPKTKEITVWSMPPENDGSFLSGHIEGHAIVLTEFPRKSLIDFVLWYRKIVPNIIPLYLTTPDNLEKSLLMTKEITEQELAEFVGFSE